jgi:hypothetical protein
MNFPRVVDVPLLGVVTISLIINVVNSNGIYIVVVACLGGHFYFLFSSFGHF